MFLEEERDVEGCGNGLHRGVAETPLCNAIILAEPGYVVVSLGSVDERAT